MITVEGGYKSIEQFKRGDQVMAAGSDLHWEARTVEFSNGTGSEGPDGALYRMHGGITTCGAVTPHYDVVFSRQ